MTDFNEPGNEANPDNSNTPHNEQETNLHNPLGRDFPKRKQNTSMTRAGKPPKTF